MDSTKPPEGATTTRDPRRDRLEALAEHYVLTAHLDMVGDLADLLAEVELTALLDAYHEAFGLSDEEMAWPPEYLAAFRGQG